MGVQVAADVREGHEMRQLTQARRFDFAVVFAQFGLDIGQAEMTVDLVLGPSGNTARAVE